MSWAIVAPAIGGVLALSAVENGALYSLQRYAKTHEALFYVIGALIYGLAIPLLLVKTLRYGGIGSVNFLWNVVSTFSGFAIGILLFGERINNLQLMGVFVALLGVGMVLLNQEQG